MPLFEYDCQDCGDTVELLIRGAEAPVCPSGPDHRLVKRLSVPAAPMTGSSKDLPISSPACNPSLPPCGPSCCKLE